MIEASKKSPLESKTASRAWALELEKAMWAEALAPKAPPERAPAPTLVEFAPRFLDYLRSRRRAPATITAYDVALRLHILPAIGKVRLDAVGRGDHERLLAAIAKLKPSTASEVVKTANRLLSVAEELQVIETRPPRCPSISRDPPSVRAYTSEEMARLLAACPQVRDKVLVFLGTHGGMRRCEIAALRREDFSPTCDAVTIVRHVWRREVRDGTKHGKVRTVRFGVSAAALLRAYLAELDGPWLFPSRPPAQRRGAPIPAYTGGCTSGGNIAARLERACTRAGVEYLGCHHLRRTGATAAARSGASPVALAAFLGHSDLRMAQRYIALQGDDGERIADALDGFGAREAQG
jgi:integrase